MKSEKLKLKTMKCITLHFRCSVTDGLSNKPVSASVAKEVIGFSLNSEFIKYKINSYIEVIVTNLK